MKKRGGGRSSAFTASAVITVTAVVAICFLISNVSCGKRGSRHHHVHESFKVAGPEPDHHQSTYVSKSEVDVCEGWYCGHGRECKVSSDGAPECICIRECKDRPKQICGTDGRRYTSHCELHRAACLLNSRLSVDHSNSCFHNSKTSQQQQQQRYPLHKSGSSTSGRAASKSHNHPHHHHDYDSDVAEKSFDYYNMEETADDVEVDGDDDDNDNAADIEDRADRSKNGFKSGNNKKRKKGSVPSAKHSTREERKHELADDDDDDDVDGEEDGLEDEFIDRENEDEDEQLPPPTTLLDERYNPAPKRAKLDAQLLDSEVDFESVLNSDGEVRSLAAAPSSPSSSSSSSSGSDSRGRGGGSAGAANNFFTSSGRNSVPITGEIRRDSSVCSPQEYEILKDNLLLYNHERMIGGVRNFKAAMESENSAKGSSSSSATSHLIPEKVYFDEAMGDGPEAGKDYLLSLMFSHFDRNNNGALEYDELHRIDKEEMMGGKLASGCNMVDLLRFDDSDHNGQLNINEFYTAFNKLYSVSVISLDKALEITHVAATVGDNVEIKCDVSGSPPMPIVWRRYGVDLSTLNQEDQVRVFSDGTLYLNKIQLLHAGNYSCHAQRNQEVVQTHILNVQTLPDVKVMPHIVWERPGQDVTMECRVMGEPFPVVQWLKNDDPLPLEMSNKYIVTGDGIRLTLKDIYFFDTGAFMCKSENSAGKRLDISSLVVIDQQTPTTVQANDSQFFVFHERGISVYDPTNCRLQHQIQATDVIPGTQQEYVCGEHGVMCEWGRAIRVSSTYVYISQPKMDRVLVISTAEMVVVDVVPTDRYPVELHYVPHLDQVWVECWRSESDDSQKTLQVIREAKEKRKHHTVHPEPIDSHFDLVEALFLPPDLKSSSQFRYGYVSHKNGRGLYKMDLIALRYTKSVDLTPYNCVPQHIEFSALYGMVIVECFEPVTNRPTGQLVLDALSDSVVYYKGDRMGRPYLSPDSRKLVTVSHGSDGTTLLLLYVRENGLEFAFDVKTSLNVSDVTFFPSQRSHTYDLFASSVDKDDVLFVDLESGKVEMVSGVGTVLVHGQWKSPQRPISSQGLFSKYIATPSTDAIFVINGQSRTVNCQIGGLHGPHSILWL